MKIVKILLALTMAFNLGLMTGCSDDDGGTNPTPTPPAVEGTWISEGSNIAPLLVTLFNYDKVVVEFNADGTVSLTTRVSGGAENTLAGTYSITTSSSGNIHAIEIVYAAFSQAGIIQVTAGNPDILRLEVVQTVPDIGAVPLTPAQGFGADVALGDSNIQTYELEEEWNGSWRSEGANIAPILVTLFNYDLVEVELDRNGTVSLTTRVSGGSATTIEGTYSVTESATGSIHSIEIVYSAFSQGGIIEALDGNPDTMRLEVVQTLPDIGAVPLTPAQGFGADVALGTSNIQNYVKFED